LVPPLPPALWSITSQRDNKRDVLERYAYYHLETRQILQILPGEQELVPPKLVILTPWRALCVDLVGPYTLKGKDGSSIDFMCLTMINPTASWFEVVELPTVRVTVPPKGNMS
jgi:hypothetical protein